MEQVVVIEKSEFDRLLRLSKAVALAHEADKRRDQPELIEVQLLVQVEEIEQTMTAAPHVQV